MPETRAALLSDRAVLRARGPDARPLLQRLVTGNLDAVSPRRAVYSLLLTPQGKFLFDFFLVADPADETAVLIDCAASRAAELLKRLTLYKLRADAAIEDASADYAVCAVWGDLPGGLALPADPAAPDAPGGAAAFAGGTAYLDPRSLVLGARALIPAGNAPEALNRLGAAQATGDDYRAFTVSLGVPDGARDIRPDGDFPIECNLDLLNGIDFRKGCFVGQEVASRVHRKGKARKRLAIARVEGGSALPAAQADIAIGGAKVGTIMGGADGVALALVFVDRVAKAGALEAEADGVPLRLAVPPYASFSLDAADPTDAPA